LETGGFDILHIHAATVPVLPILFQKYSRTLTVGTLHTYFESSVFYRIARGISQRYLDALDGVIAVAPSCIEAVGRYFDFKRGYRIIPNGVDIDWFSRPTGLLRKYADRRPTVLFLGRLDPRNGLDTLLDAFFLLLREMPDARLIVVGDGPLRTLYERQAGTLLGRSVFFEGQIGDLRPDYFSRCDVFCYPATKASFGITLLEAMAAGKAVVAVDNCGFRELITHGKTGLLVPPNDPTALSKALLSILQNPALAQSLATHAQNGIQSFSWSTVTDKILSYYDDIYREKKGIPFAA
jgi:phosphatidylinositol alpha-mannosyltransferase